VSPSRRAGWAAFVLALATLVAVFFSSCEKRTVDFRRGYQGEAARNKYLAAQRLLERMGTPVRSFADLSGLSELPPADATMILPTERKTLGASRSAELLRWVEGGGHLVTVSWQIFEDPERTRDLVLDPIGVRQYLNEDEEEDGEEEGEAPSVEPEDPFLLEEPESPGIKTIESDEDPEAPGPEVALAEFPDRETPLEVEFDPEFRFELGPEAVPARVFAIADANGTHLVVLQHGKGLVTALTDDYFLAQPTIGERDHAELVYRLAHWGGRFGPVWIFYGDAYPSAAALLWRHGWMVVVTAGLVLALWLWSASRRFGPLAPNPTRERRELMEHVRAAGLFQWRRGAAPALLAAVREAVLARVRERHPSLTALDPAQQAERLAQLADLPRERVSAALAFQTDSEAGRFAKDVAVLEKIRRSL
jgi:Domain of unknown function (DUF4350)